MQVLIELNADVGFWACGALRLWCGFGYCGVWVCVVGLCLGLCGALGLCCGYKRLFKQGFFLIRNKLF